MKKLTKNEFVEKATKKHNGFYSYEKTVYVNSQTKTCITCPKHGDFQQTPANHLRGQVCWHCGNERNAKRNHETPRFYQRKVHYGVGISDYNGSLKDKAYIAWMNMLKRCYDESVRHKFPTYKNCTVCKEWLSFSVFREWFYENYIEGYSLDKDILVKGNKLYSPSTCCFVPKEINAMLTKGDAIRGKLPLGVEQIGRKFLSRITINKKNVSLGLYDTPEEAFHIYKKEKENHIFKVAKEYFEKGLICEEVYKALINYKIDITD